MKYENRLPISKSNVWYNSLEPIQSEIRKLYQIKIISFFLVYEI